TVHRASSIWTLPTPFSIEVSKDALRPIKRAMREFSKGCSVLLLKLLKRFQYTTVMTTDITAKIINCKYQTSPGNKNRITALSKAAMPIPNKKPPAPRISKIKISIPNDNQCQDSSTKKKSIMPPVYYCFEELINSVIPPIDPIMLEASSGINITLLLSEAASCPKASTYFCATK